ncbi:mechanosensitive ion channel family protein [Parerythrobacter jejuensis]|uniref:Mechanosensitive ion channel n=1 Tax=Parerythrobacter jejuensis TaxID=795812 RepID=A0A845AT27_9SPHN|nr:mechanosensitive ion channel domain-containing protein [Parerythrobacter jejuensis]MXP30700.1 mechanosensitive ion channel [Parerythrobacter jejuensis]MXP33460.1 mechanosensitive ion channel [Parerythrobacter jejuensis]
MFDDLNPANFDIDWHLVLAEGAVSLLVVVIAVALSYVAYRLVFKAVSKITHMSESVADDILIQRIRQPIKWSFIAIGVTLAAQVDDALGLLWEPFAQFLRPALLGWIAYNMVRALTAALQVQVEASGDPVALRSRKTRVAVLSRIATLAIILITIGLMLFSIPSVRSIGTTMLASAGLAALAIGAAAQPALKSLIAGLQIALTEPLRIGDLVVVDGHTGRIEEIRMSFITVRTWDERVIIVPTSRFLDESFENWSRRNEMLTGPVYLHLDPITDLDPIRAEFERFVHAHELWDKRTAVLLMTEAHPESVELRLSVSAGTIGDLWALRCALREHMIKWLRETQPEALIRHRLEVESANDRAST